MSPRGRSGSGGAIWIGSISLISQLDKIPEVPVEPRIRRLHEGLSASQMRVEFGSPMRSCIPSTYVRGIFESSSSVTPSRQPILMPYI